MGCCMLKHRALHAECRVLPRRAAEAPAHQQHVVGHRQWAAAGEGAGALAARVCAPAHRVQRCVPEGGLLPRRQVPGLAPGVPGCGARWKCSCRRVSRTSYFLFTTRHAMCAGAEIKLSRPFDDKHPVLLGRLGRNPDRPTICFYGHYGQSWRPSLALMLHALVVGRTAL